MQEFISGIYILLYCIYTFI